MKNKKSKKIKRIYLQYLDDNGLETTLPFRSEESMNQHINEQKISNILYSGTKRPFNLDTCNGVRSIRNAMQSFDECYGMEVII